MRNSYDKNMFNNNFLNINKNYNNNTTSMHNRNLQRLNNTFFPESFNEQRFQNATKNDATLKTPFKDFGKPKEEKHLTKDEMKMLVMENRFKQLEKKNEDDKRLLLRFINSGVNAPVNTLLQYQHVREQEETERKEIENRREYTKRELQRAQEQLKRELEFSSDGEEDTYQEKIERLDKKLKKQVAKYQEGPLNNYDTEKGLLNTYDKSYKQGKKNFAEHPYPDSLLGKNPHIENLERDIKYMDVDYENKINQLRKNDKRAFASLKAEMYQKMGDIGKLLDRQEQRNLLAIEYLRTIFEGSGSKRLKYLSKRVLGGEEVSEEKPEEPMEYLDSYKLVRILLYIV